MKESVGDSYEEMNKIVGKAIDSMKTERVEKVKQKESSEALTKLREENLNLKTNLEMITYDLAEFDELSLETQMLREGQFRAEKRMKESEEEIRSLRREKIDLVKQMDNLKKEQAEKIREIQLDTLDREAKMDDGRSTIEALKGEVDELKETLGNSNTENRHLSERIAAAMEDLAKQR
jgi:chromosome segregation ATPase